MSQAPDPASTPPEFSSEEWMALVDAEAWRYFQISGEEFRRRYEAGELDVEDPHVWQVALMLTLPTIAGRVGVVAQRADWRKVLRP